MSKIHFKLLPLAAFGNGTLCLRSVLCPTVVGCQGSKGNWRTLDTLWHAQGSSPRRPRRWDAGGQHGRVQPHRPSRLSCCRQDQLCRGPHGAVQQNWPKGPEPCEQHVTNPARVTATAVYHAASPSGLTASVYKGLPLSPCHFFCLSFAPPSPAIFQFTSTTSFPGVCPRSHC